MKKPVALIVLDGWGYSEDPENNAVMMANTPFYDSLWQKYPHTLLEASGTYVGLPEGQIGNSEIGHTTIGAGKIIDTDLVRIAKEIENGDFAKNETLQNGIKKAAQSNSQIHVISLIGEGGVHSHQSHFDATVEAIKKDSSKVDSAPVKTFLHLFTDGRDCGPFDSISFLEKIEKMQDNNVKVGSISGRYFAMDRDKNWDRFDKWFDLVNPKITVSEIKDVKADFVVEVKKQHQDGLTDEHIKPFLVNDCEIKENDVIIILNFRADRVRMLVEKLIELKTQKNLEIITMTNYSSDFQDVNVIYSPMEIKGTLASEISKKGLKQTHIAETEKFAHATYFLNGGKNDKHPGEEHILIESRKDVVTHDLAPEMKCCEIASEAIRSVENGDDFLFVNFANADMVGHTANVQAIVKSLEILDGELQKLVSKILENDGVAVITADHGNAELNFDSEKGESHTSHTTNLVPLIIVSNDMKSIKDRFKIENFSDLKKEEKPSLKDITPTIFKMLEIEKPEFMTGESLI